MTSPDLLDTDLLQPVREPEVPLRRYRPSNGTEGAIFMDAWCSNCNRDAVMNGKRGQDEARDDELCPIIAASFRGEVPEWVYDEHDHPCCTAFVPFTDDDGRETWVRVLDERVPDPTRGRE